MFAWCSKLATIKGLENFDGTCLQNMGCMFRECMSLKEIDFSNLNAAPETVTNMFYSCTKLKTLKMGNVKGNKLDFESLNPVEYIFNKCKKLEYVELSKSLTAAIALNKSASECKCILKNK
jgi:surface protein